MARLGPEGDPARPQEHGQRQPLPGQQGELEQYLGDPAAVDDAEGGRGHHAEEAAETQRRQGRDDALMAASAPVEGRIGLVGAVAGSGGGLVDGVVDVGGGWHGVRVLRCGPAWALLGGELLEVLGVGMAVVGGRRHGRHGLHCDGWIRIVRQNS